MFWSFNIYTLLEDDKKIIKTFIAENSRENHILNLGNTDKLSYRIVSLSGIVAYMVEKKEFWITLALWKEPIPKSLSANIIIQNCINTQRNLEHLVFIFIPPFTVWHLMGL